MIKKITVLAVIVCCTLSTYAQDAAFSRSSIKTGFGIGFNEGARETGMGTLYAIGYQKSYWQNRVRLNPNLLMGGFIPFGITDTRAQYYRISSLGFNAYLDALRFRSVSLFVNTGVFLNYSRGLLGTGGDRVERNRSEYFFRLYYGANVGGGLRVDPKKSRLAFELSPVNVHIGSNRFVLGYMKLGLDIKLNAPVKN